MDRRYIEEEAYCWVGSSPCEDCDRFWECYDNNSMCQEKEDWQEKYDRAVEEREKRYNGNT